VDQSGTKLPGALSRALSIAPSQQSQQWHHSSVCRKVTGCRSKCWQAGEKSSSITNPNDTIQNILYTARYNRLCVTNTMGWERVQRQLVKARSNHNSHKRDEVVRQASGECQLRQKRKHDDNKQ
jgi:hypothetical protein